MADRKQKRTSGTGSGRRSVKAKSRRRKKQNRGRMVFCIAVELIVVLILVLVVGWNYGMGTQLFDWIEQMRKPVVKELDISGINTPYACAEQVRGGRVIGEINGEEQMSSGIYDKDNDLTIVAHSKISKIWSRRSH